MAHHKRRRPKNRRAGCLACKPHKANGVKKRANLSGPANWSGWSGLTRTWKQEARAAISEREQRNDVAIGGH